MQLAIWMTSRDNPYLAKAAVNRAWAQMLGRGLVEPVDDLRPENPPSHPELFEELSQHFVRSGFDMKSLYRTLANTKAYQASSRQVVHHFVHGVVIATLSKRSIGIGQFVAIVSVAA